MHLEVVVAGSLSCREVCVSMGAAGSGCTATAAPDRAAGPRSALPAGRAAREQCDHGCIGSTLSRSKQVMQNGP